MRPRRVAGDDIDTFFESDLHLPSRTIYCGNEVGRKGTEAEFFLKGMTLLLAASEDPITVIMNNAGGDEYHGLAIYDAIATCPARVTAKVFGHAMSMGSWILQAADVRLVAPCSTLLLHYGSWDQSIEAPSPDRMNSYLAEAHRLNDLMEDVYLGKIRARQPEFSRARLRKKLTNEWFIPAAEAVELGLADEVIR